MKIPHKDPAVVVVPFGKHRGATVAELLEKDPAYADWIMAQGWVAERFAELHAAIATRGAGQDDSPEHNALQVKFLQPRICSSFLYLVVPDRLAQQKERRERYAAESKQEGAVRLDINPKFEQRGVDVLIEWCFVVGDEYKDIAYFGGKCAIEIKPSLGDDYPTVMRQMARLGASSLVVQNYTGRGVALPDLRQMFAANGQTLVTVQEIEAAMQEA